MYRGVKLDPRDWKYQQILWRFSPYEPIQTYEINRVCFGVSSSPFHALRVIKQLIKDEGDRFPAAAQVLDTDVYIDDVCTGASSVDEACQLRADLSALLGKAGFELRKWSSSHPSVLAGLDVDLLEKPHKFGDAETIQVLGIQWDSKEDVFCYQVETLSDCLTKRQVLSQIARMYDLPGFLGPVVIWMKILLQQVWLQGLGWDDPLLDQWNKFVSDMPCLRELKIPRYILDTYVYPPELIGFSDASSSAMAAVVYLRVVCSDQRVLVNLIRAKTKVAPVKPVTIPRLELTASYMLALLVESLQPFREQLRIETIKLFTDSMVVLSWLRTPPHLLKVFVANRVVKILDVTLPTQWSHVPTTENPADIASRGCFPSHLVQHDMWWHGPPFLLDDPASWPKCPQVVPTEPVPELKSPVVSAHVTIDNCGTAFLERFSSFTRAQRVIAWILRFKQNCLRKPEERLLANLKVVELDQAERVMIRITQSFHFDNVFKTLENKGKLPVSIQQLSPFILDQCLRVGGRIDKSPLPYDSRHPYLLPANSHLASLIVRYFHMLSLHGGPKLVQTLVHAKYFIPGLRNLVRKTLFQCVQCYRFNAKPRQPFMAELPLSRFMQGRPFIHTGVDLAGPFALKDGSRRNAPILKGYFAIFVCFAVKAVHLEPLSSLSTDCFLACFDRFIARRGLPSTMFSDQGTNFKGAARFLDETHRFLLANNSEISEHLSLQKVQWSFNAPANPSAGGIWEAGVKSAKSHLKHILTDRPLQFEEFATVLCRVEMCLNSRSIGVPSSLSPEDTPDSLTPGHFLIGAPLLARPETDLTELPSNRLPRWGFLSQIIQHFWRRWKREYLHSLIQRQKWLGHSDNIKVGDVVVVVSENQTPTHWPLARVVELLPANDGVVRVVSIKTATGKLTRPVRKLLILPVYQ
uniref:Integrase catalytic domain-containing protein n=1 Tax=Cacopsylla melanoneura TaxID=428564 RepID=A0A8D9B754_9HEMI